MSILFEAPVFNVESALKAAGAGVDRLELCSSFAAGGETPGAGMLDWLKRKVDVPVFVMIRPRGGNFICSSDEIEVMKREIYTLGKTGADGFVFGILAPDHSIHTEACGELVRQAGNKPCTFHRAFDSSRDAQESLDSVIECGFTRILTSGMKNSVGEGLPVLKELLAQAGSRITIMPGGGLKPDHVKQLKSTGRLREIHASCKKMNINKGVPEFDEKIFDKYRNVLIS